VQGDPYEADRHSELIAIAVSEWIRSVVGASDPDGWIFQKVIGLVKHVVLWENGNR
jgi:hypothetical protein